MTNYSEKSNPEKLLDLGHDLPWQACDSARNDILPDQTTGGFESYFDFLEAIGALDRKKVPTQFVDAEFSLE